MYSSTNRGMYRIELEENSHFRKTMKGVQKVANKIREFRRKPEIEQHERSHNAHRAAVPSSFFPEYMEATKKAVIPESTQVSWHHRASQTQVGKIEAFIRSKHPMGQGCSKRCLNP